MKSYKPPHKQFGKSPFSSFDTSARGPKLKHPLKKSVLGADDTDEAAPAKSSFKKTAKAPVHATPYKKPTRPLDGLGQPYITLAQYLKLLHIVESGGQGKHRVRAGGIKVNGTEELRPGRKLHTGDKVYIDGNERSVKI